MSGFWGDYVSVAKRREKAKKEMQKLRKKGKDIQPIELDGRTIARSFWGKGWCDHLESFSDYENRLPRGRTYVRNGSVCHLEIQAGQIEAMVSGSSLYKTTIKIKSLAPATWKAIKDKCRGQIGSLLELLQGKLSNHVMEVVSDHTNGLFPHEDEIELRCSCPDWATMCKHVAAVLYGVGSRLDHSPELLFLLRGVDAAELIAAEVALPAAGHMAAKDTLAEDGLADIFGIDIDMGDTPGTPKQDTVERVRTRKTTKKATTAAKKTVSTPEPPIAKPAKEAKAIIKTKVKAKAKAKKSTGAKTLPPVFDPKAPTGAAIARMRKQADLSVADFARSLGVTAASVYRWENIPGALRLNTNTLMALSKIQETLS